jgi:hypothetical protein
MTNDDRNSNRGRKPDDLDAALQKTKDALTYDSPLTAAQEMATQMVSEGRFEFRRIAETVLIDTASFVPCDGSDRMEHFPRTTREREIDELECGPSR